MVTYTYHFHMYACTCRVSLFSSDAEEDVEDFNPLATIRLFIKYVDHLIIIALEVNNYVNVHVHVLVLNYSCS